MTSSAFTTLTSDPCPGDPDGIGALGTQLRKVALLLTGTALKLDRTDASQGRWKGEAADAFRTRLNTHRATLGKIRASLEECAVLLDGWAAALRDFQDEARRLDAAATELDAAHSKAAHLLLSTHPTAGAAPAALAADATAHTAAVHRADDLAGRLTGVLGQADALNSRYLEASRAVAARMGGLLTLPAGGTDWYGTATDTQQLTSLQAGGDGFGGPVVLPDDDQNVQNALAYFNQHINDPLDWFPLFGGSVEMLLCFQALTPGEQAAFADDLTPQQLAELNFDLGSATPDVRTAWANILLPNASPEALALIQQDVPILQPAFTDDNANASYKAFGDDPLFGPDGPRIKQDLSQGGCGDCWFLSSVAAIAERDPGFFPQHIKENPNGTYTVTFYQDGKPVPVTVDNQLPVSKAWSGTEYAHTDNNVMWVAVYEKAYAQWKGGYDVIGQGGFGNEGLHDLTGQATYKSDPSDMSLTQLADKINNGYAVTTGSKDQSTGFLWWTKHPEYTDDDKIVTLHEYSVESVNLNAHPPTVTLLNPWGAGQKDGAKYIPQEVTLTQDQWRQYYNEVSYTKTRV